MYYVQYGGEHGGWIHGFQTTHYEQAVETADTYKRIYLHVRIAKTTRVQEYLELKEANGQDS